MDHVLVAEELEGLEDLNRESSYQRQGDALEVVVLDELVEVDREELEGDDQVVAEHAVVLDLDYVVLVVGVLLLQVLQDAQLNARLMLITLFVLYDFYCDDFVGFVV